MMRLAVSIVSLCLLMTSSCHRGAHYEELCGDYVLFATDTMDDMILGRERNIIAVLVPKTVYGAGCQDGFIIAKQHPREFRAPYDRSVVNYFIIVTTAVSKESTHDEIIGPLTASEFAQKRAELGVPATLKFTRVFSKLE